MIHKISPLQVFIESKDLEIVDGNDKPFNIMTPVTFALAANICFAVAFLIGCLIIFSIERYKTNKEWGLNGILLALTAVTLDGAGILLTRYAFDLSPELHAFEGNAFEGNAYRCGGAVLGLFALSFFRRPIELCRYFQELTWKTRIIIFLASLLGTFLSLGFYLEAIRIGDLATVSAVAITGPFFAALFEYLYKRTWPSWYFIGAFALFAVGFFLLNS